MSEIKGPPPRPCESCPYRQDVPSGVWSAEEYDKLEEYDQPTHAQPMNLFQCHQNGADDAQARLCAGWVATHGERLLSLRIAVSMNRVPADVMDYETDVPCFESGTAAADHGRRDIDFPSDEAREMVAKICGRRDDVVFG